MATGGGSLTGGGLGDIGSLGGGLTGQTTATNPNLIPTIDNALNSTVTMMDTQLASVGIGIGSGAPQAAATTPTVAPTATTTGQLSALA
jgi:hypothetical protein